MRYVFVAAAGLAIVAVLLYVLAIILTTIGALLFSVIATI